ncbi:DctP family TRAP transporter solute-binding subunit [Massilia sp. S19_KUP03_FR1]|uniref:DctP family TRAP transporter solute-binding subunit n=1 Tax=Massilia sp. S19_KUP03_FR1 TaxID=3025503 RepID=UPI002FCD7719
MHIKFLAAALVAALSAPALAQAPGSGPIVIKFSHVVSMETPKGQAAELFKTRAEKLTKGRVRVEVYANSSLYKDKDELEALQDDKVQMLAPSLGKLGPFGVTEFELFELPYLFPTKEALYKVTDGPIGKSLLAKLEPKGILGLAYWDNGFKVMSANKPLHTVADFKGLKMRVQSASKVLDAQTRALGATPLVTNFADVYPGMKSGAIDGADNPPSNMYTQNMHQVQKHVTVTNHAYMGYAIVVNKKFWDGLPADIRAQLDVALREATAYQKAMSQVDNDRSIDGMKKAGKTTIYVPTAAEDAAFRKTLAPVQLQVENRIGKDLLMSISKVAN